MSKKAMSSKIVSAKNHGEKLLQEQEEIFLKEENIEISAKKLAGRKNQVVPAVKCQEEWKENQVVSFNKVSLRFTKEYFALFEVSFDAYQSERIALLGEHECGKTSILRILAALETPFSGSVKIFNKKPTAKLFQKDVMLGFLPENPALLEKKTVLENMVFAKRIREKGTQTDADVASGLLFDLGLIDLKNKVAGEMPYFEKQCLAVARFAFRKLDVLLIDNIFDHLTEEEIASLVHIIEKVINEKTLIIFTTTDIIIAKNLAKRVIKIENGSLTE